MAVELGTAATQDSSAFATAAQGLEADSAVQSIVAGTGVTVDAADPQNPVVNATGVGGGTVTSVSVAAANGFLASVATPTTTPDITIKTGVTGILYGNGTGVSAAVAGNFPTLNQNTTGNAATATATASLGAVATIAALRLYSGTAFGQTVFMQGYTTQNDGGQGPFQWGAYATDNGGTIITPTGQLIGSWYRLIENNIVTVSQFGGDKTGVADSTAAFLNLSTFAGIAYDIGWEGGSYKVSSLPTVSSPQTIKALGQVTITHTGSGILFEVLNAHTTDSWPIITGPIYLIPGSSTTELFRWEGTFFGQVSNLIGDGTANQNIIGCHIVDSPTAGVYYNVFTNCIFKYCGTNWCLATINHGGNSGYVNDNTFINCKAQFGKFGGSIWTATKITGLGALIVPTGTGGNFTGSLFQCTTAGTTGASEPTWSTATNIGNTVSDGTVTWTRINWDSVTQTGAGWLVVHAEGNSWFGGDSESNGGYSFIDSKGSDLTAVYGMWIENSGTQFPATHSVLIDNIGNYVPTLKGIIFQPVTIDGSIDINPGDTVGTQGSIPVLSSVQSSPSIVSGTLYRNLNGVNVILYVSVTFTPTATVAATCTIKLGSTSTPNTLAVETVPIGTALDSFIRLLRIDVPAGWYYTFTVTNATIGTVTQVTGV